MVQVLRHRHGCVVRFRFRVSIRVSFRVRVRLSFGVRVSVNVRFIKLMQWASGYGTEWLWSRGECQPLPVQSIVSIY